MNPLILHTSLVGGCPVRVTSPSAVSRNRRLARNDVIGRGMPEISMIVGDFGVKLSLTLFLDRT